MTSSSFIHQGRRWFIAAVLVPILARPASAQLAPAGARDTMKFYIGWWQAEVPAMLTRIATVLDSGFVTADRERVLREMRAIRPEALLGKYVPPPARSYLFQVRFRGRPSDLDMRAYWPDTGRVALRFHSSDTLLLDAIDSTFRAARMALLSAPKRVRIRLEDAYVHDDPLQVMTVALAIDEATHCPGFGVETHGEWRGDTVMIHVDGVAPRDSCPYGAWPPRMWYPRAATPGQYHMAIDYKADTNRFAVRVTDTSLALTTIRSTFAVADERIQWRVPSGGFVLSCSQPSWVRASLCNDLQTWAERRAGLQRVVFDTTGVSPLRNGAVAYRSEDRALASMRSCIGAISPQLRLHATIELRIRPRSGPWFVDRIAREDSALRVASNPSCGLPRSIVDYGLAPVSGAQADCPVPARDTRNLVVALFLRQKGTQQWFREQKRRAAGHGERPQSLRTA